MKDKNLILVAKMFTVLFAPHYFPKIPLHFFLPVLPGNYRLLRLLNPVRNIYSFSFLTPFIKYISSFYIFYIRKGYYVNRQLVKFLLIIKII